jgi:hypothetical protein
MYRSLMRYMRTSDWNFYGVTHAGIFCAMLAAGGVAMLMIGPPDQEEVRQRIERDRRR